MTTGLGGGQSAAADPWAGQREQMMEQLVRHGISDKRVLDAMRAVPRHAFIPESLRRQCNPYGDHPCSIGHGQTISQPYIVAYMTQRMEIRPGDKVLEIGTGSGYQTAVLAEMGAEVYSVEVVPALHQHAKAALETAGYGGLHLQQGNGYKGWPEHSPFNAIILTCAPETVPAALVDQLSPPGVMVAPIGPAGSQRMIIVHRLHDKTNMLGDIAVRFVPMV